jgi:metallophosphoesterase superfamily enzyme
VKWRNDFSSLHIQLVKGNHDILKKDWYSSVNISLTTDHLSIDNFCFVHDIKEACETSGKIDYYFSGHMHPCISLKGIGRQALKFPCYHFTEQHAVLPAFGKFTGTALIKKKPSDKVFAVLPSNEKNGEMATIMRID